MKPTQEMITIVGDGITVTARKYVDGELTCSARCLKKLDAAYNFDKQATDAMYALMTKQNDSVVEYCKADADATKEYYGYRKAHPEMFPEEQEDDKPECEVPESDAQDEATKYPKIYQSVADIPDDANIIYYACRPELFWKDFKQGKFIIKVSMNEWSELAASAKPYRLRWFSLDALDEWAPFKVDTDDIYIGVSCSKVVYSRVARDFREGVCIAWIDIKEALKTTETSTNDAKDASLPWKDIMDRKSIVRVRKQDWKKFVEQAATDGIRWNTGAKFSPDDIYPGGRLDVNTVYLGCSIIPEGLVWGTDPEDFKISEPTVIHFSGWCDND